MGVSQAIADHVAVTTLDDIPSAVRAAAKQLMLDTLGVAWAGSDAPGIPEAHRVVAAEGGRPESTVWGYGDILPATAAAFINSSLAAALDYDSVHQGGQVHADIIALPACLAVAQRQHSTGAEFLTALVLSTELICRLGKAAKVNSGWFFTSIHGVFGAAAGAARLLRLDRDAIANALGIALSHVGGTQQALVEKSLTKRLQAGFVARGGVFSALLAAEGITGPKESIEGKFGFYALYESGSAEKLLDGLGKRYELVETTTKKYPSCTCNHTLIDGVVKIAIEKDLTPEDVQSVEVVLSPFMNQLVGAPFDPRENPQVTAQFSAQYSVASAILRRRLGIAEIQAPSVLEPAIANLANRVRVTVDAGNTGKFAPTEIILESNRHGQIRRRMEHVPGTPEYPMTAAEHRSKFSECTLSGSTPLSSEKSSVLAERVNQVESIPDMARFFDGIMS